VDSLCQRGRDFKADEILRIVQAALTLIVRYSEPIASNYDEHSVARIYGALNDFDEVFAWLNTVDVHKNLIGSELLLEAIGKPSGYVSVFAPIAYEYRGHGRFEPILTDRHPRSAVCL
jgi:hypothetical protein